MSSGAVIQKLPVEVINRIAAGEVVQRPSAALKELMENSLDAGSTNVVVTAQEGGMEVLQVADDGSGVRYADLPLLCERYATSKLRSFADLQSLRSFGFRGEALASVSYVSRVTVTTKRRPEATETGRTADTQDGRVAWRCRYMDGALTEDPQPCAGNYGTTVRVEKMFYNAQVRRAALKAGEEWRRVLDVVARYALAFPHVGFSCQKDGGGDGLVFPKDSTTLSNARLLLGHKAASHLRFIFYYDKEGALRSTSGAEAVPAHGGLRKGETCHSVARTHTDSDDDGGHTANHAGRHSSVAGHAGSQESVQTHGQGGPAQVAAMDRVRAAAEVTQKLSGSQGEGQFVLWGYTSDATLLSRKSFLTLFVNNRLVESGAVRRAVDGVYSSVLTGGNRPTTVLFLAVPADRVDVNVHPTKQEVCLLDEELVLGRLVELVRAALVEAAAERQVDVTRLSKATTLALQAAVRYSGASHGVKQEGEPGSSAARGVATFLQQQRQQHSLRNSSGCSDSGGLLGGGGGGGGGAATIPAPSSMVRMEPQRGALDAFLRPIKSPANDAPVIKSEVPVSGDAEDHRRGVAEVVDWSAVIASVKPVLEPDDNADKGTPSAPAIAQREERASDLDKGPGRPIVAAWEEGCRTVPRDTVNSRAAGDSDDDEELADVMREFKRFRQEAEETGVSLAAQAVPERAFLPSAAHVCSDRDESSNSVQLILQGEVAAAPPRVEECEGGGGLVKPIELEDHLLSSVAATVHDLVARSGVTAQTFADSLAFVGVFDDGMFLAQSETSLLAMDTLRLVREVVYQRIFLRWAQPSLPKPPLVTFTRAVAHAPSQRREPRPHRVKVFDALLFAMFHDSTALAAFLNSASPLMRLVRDAAVGGGGAAKKEPGKSATGGSLGGHPRQGSSGPAKGLSELDTKLVARIPALLFRQHTGDAAGDVGVLSSATAAEDETTPTPTPTEGCRRYVRSLVRRLSCWRDMLEEYFNICLTAEGYLVGLPCGLNTAWPPSMRAVPLFLWLLAETTPFPDACAVAAVEEESAAATDSPPQHQPLSPLPDAEVEAERRCFEHVARLVSDVLYGLDTSHLGASTPEEDGPTQAHVDAAESVATQRPIDSREQDASTGPTAAGKKQSERQRQALAHRASLGKAIQFGLMPCLKNRMLFLPPMEMLSDGTAQSVVTVESLYKVFERC